MRFGLQHPSFRFDGKASQFSSSLARSAKSAEEVGFDSFWLMDHFHQIKGLGGPEEPIMEGWTTLAFLSGVTSRIKLGTLVTGAIYRYPSVLAKIGATFDVLSQGRLFMGIGASWHKEEARAYGIPFPTTKERLDRLEEAAQILLMMWTSQRASFKGKYYQIEDAYCTPSPLQKPHPPLLIGGGGEQKTLRLVAKYADACNIFGSTKTVERKLQILKEHCRQVNRDYNSILKTMLARVIIGRDRVTVDRRVKETMPGMTEHQRKEMAIYGTINEVANQISEFEKVGIQYLIINFPDGHEAQSVELFGREIA